jgi:type III restriction enzyme
MMSFRKAVDDTLIAQLVGRMVRTPLAVRVETNEVLNSVTLALPHYDEGALDAIVKKLQDPELGSAGEATDEKDVKPYRRAADKADLFDALANVPTYVVDRPRRIANSSRLMKLARFLTMHGVSQGLQGQAKRFVIDRLLEQRERLSADPQWAARVKGSATIPVREFTIECGEWKLGLDHETYSIPATDENIHALFERCAGILGEGLHDSYANRVEFRGDMNTARLEIFLILQDEKAPKLVQEACEREFERLWAKHKDEIEDLLPPLREKFKELRRRSGKALAEPMTLVQVIEIRKESPNWADHLFVDESGNFGWKANTWERPVLEAEMARQHYAGFLRNMARKSWALCVPYGPDGDRAFYPDMFVFSRRKNKVAIDLLEPHGDQYADHLPKAKGLALYAKAHGELFGRIEMIRLSKNKLQRLDMQDEKVLKATPEQVDDLYTELG